jgi:hypothetical protein
MSAPETIEHDVEDRASQDEDEEFEEDVDKDNELWQEATREYQSTNSLLHDLHTLHQHRLRFSTPSPSLPSHLFSDSSAHSTPSLGSGPMTKSFQPACTQSHYSGECHKCIMDDPLHMNLEDKVEMKEVQSVKQWYEDKNR